MRQVILIIDDEEKILIQQIIKVIEEKGIVNSEDIKEIIEDFDLTFIAIHSGLINGGGAGIVDF